MVLGCGLMPATRYIVSGASGSISGAGQVQPLPISGTGPPGEKLQTLLWLLGACAVLGASWERLYCNTIPATTVQGLGHVVRGTGNAEAIHHLSGVYGTLRDIR